MSSWALAYGLQGTQKWRAGFWSRRITWWLSEGDSAPVYRYKCPFGDVFKMGHFSSDQFQGEKRGRVADENYWNDEDSESRAYKRALWDRVVGLGSTERVGIGNHTTELFASGDLQKVEPYTPPLPE